MAELTIGDKTITVDDSFLKLSAAEQHATVDHIAAQIGVQAAPADDPARATARTRQRDYRQSLREGSPELPAGQGASGPDLSSERLTPEQMGTQWRDVGKGLAKGIPAAASGGLVGDVEQMGRQLTKEFGVDQKTIVPTTTEAGYLGPKGLDVMAPAATPQEAGGMAIASIFLPGMKKLPGALRMPEEIKRPPFPGGPGAADVAPPTAASLAPFEMHPEAPTPITRPDTGARLLPSDVPHRLPPDTETIIPKGMGGNSAGAAAATGPLERVTPTSVILLRKQLAEDGFTPWTIDQRLEEMSPHHMLFEVSPNMENQMQRLAKYPGDSKNTVVSSLSARAQEAPERIRNALDDAFGEPQNLSVKRRELSAEQKRASAPFWDAFTKMEVTPTPELDALMPRLRAANAIGRAKQLAAIEGKPWTNAFDMIDGDLNITKRQVPTPASWQLVKEALDARIEESFNARGQATKMTRAYTQLKNDLIAAIDNHPNKDVGTVWKAARDTWAGPAQLKSAHQLGTKILSESIDKNELPFMTESYSPAQRQALAEGMRADLENRLGRPGPQNRRLINQILSPNAQAKIRTVVGDQEAERLFGAINHEGSMHDAPTRIYGGSQTANRIGGRDDFAAQIPYYDKAAGALGTGIGLITDPKNAVVDIGHRFATKAMKERGEAAAQNIRDGMAILYTMQGPERDAVLRWLVGTARETPRRLGQ